MLIGLVPSVALGFKTRSTHTTAKPWHMAAMTLWLDRLSVGPGTKCLGMSAFC